jgi:hypothetical protein
MMKAVTRVSLVLSALSLAACVSVPTGPSVMALPGTGKSFDQFRLDETDCRQYSTAQVGGTDANQAAIDSGVKSAVVGSVIGAAAGAAIGGNSRGAATGAGVGLLGGSIAGNDAGRTSGGELQRRYDQAFIQCMYSKGHRVPVQGQFISNVEKQSGPATSSPPPPAPSGLQPSR